MPDPARHLLRHTLATLAYRAGKVLRDAPEGFAAFSAGESTRTPAEILAHMGDLLGWALAMADDAPRRNAESPLPWDREIARFFAALERLDRRLAEGDPLAISPERLFQGPIADALTHVGQLAMLRRLAGAPVARESYARAEIEVGRVGAEHLL